MPNPTSTSVTSLLRLHEGQPGLWHNADTYLHTHSAGGVHGAPCTARMVHADAIESVCKLPTGSVHAVITDPPYGLTATMDVNELLDAWRTGLTYVNDAPGYMGHDWDHSVPGPELWAEVKRALRPGGYVLAFSSARTLDLTGLAMRLGGLAVRDTLHWTYATARLTTPDLSRLVLRLSSDEHTASQVAGKRATLRPAHEPILVARSPLPDDRTLLDNVLEFGTGAVNHHDRVRTNVITTHDTPCSETACSTECPIEPSAHGNETEHLYPDSESAYGSLYVRKPNKAERPVAPNGLQHDTVKPLELMRYLIRVFSDPGHVVLDPFLGSGTTAEAALLENRNFLGCDLNHEYRDLWEQRMKRLESNITEPRGQQRSA